MRFDPSVHLLIPVVGGRLLDRDRNPDEISSSENRYAIVATRIYRGAWEYQLRHEDRHLFVIAADMAFQTCDNMVNMNYLVELFNVACQAAQTCFDNSWMNCGCYYDLPWVETLLNKLRQRPILHFPWFYLLRLLDCLDDALEKGLLTGDRELISNQLEALRAMCPTPDGSIKDGKAPALVPEAEMASEPPEEFEATVNRLLAQTVVSDEVAMHTRSLSSGSNKSSATIPDSTIFASEYTPPLLRNRMSVASVATIDYPLNSPDALAPYDQLFPSALRDREGSTPITSVEPPSPTSTTTSSIRGSIIGRLRSASDTGLSPVSPSPTSDYFTLAPTAAPPTQFTSPAQWDGGRRRAFTFTGSASRLSMSVASSVPETISESLPLTIMPSAHAIPPRTSPPHPPGSRRPPPLSFASISDVDSNSDLPRADILMPMPDVDASRDVADPTDDPMSAFPGFPVEPSITA